MISTAVSLAVPGLVDAVSDAACEGGRLFGTDMLCYAFMQRAFLVGLFIGLVGPLIGTFLVHREMALIGDSLSHTAFAGVAIGLFFAAVTGWTGSPLLVATVVTVIAALLIQYLAEQAGEYGDVAMAIILTGAFALGTVLISISGGISVSIASYLFGNIVTVTEQSVTLLGGLTALVLVVLALTHKQLLFVTFDEEAARVARFNVSLYNRMLVVLTALVVVAALQILGVILGLQECSLSRWRLGQRSPVAFERRLYWRLLRVKFPSLSDSFCPISTTSRLVAPLFSSQLLSIVLGLCGDHLLMGVQFSEYSCLSLLSA